MVWLSTNLEVKYMILLITIVVLALILLTVVAMLMQQIFNSLNYQAKMVPIVIKNNQNPHKH